MTGQVTYFEQLHKTEIDMELHVAMEEVSVSISRNKDARESIVICMVCVSHSTSLTKARFGIAASRAWHETRVFFLV
jgi:hypothetical protein